MIYLQQDSLNLFSVMLTRRCYKSHFHLITSVKVTAFKTYDSDSKAFRLGILTLSISY
jgi:hypothetical protein